MHHAGRFLRSHLLCCAVIAAALAGAFPSAATADDQLLKEAVEFTGVVTFVAHKVPALVDASEKGIGLTSKQQCSQDARHQHGLPYQQPLGQDAEQQPAERARRNPHELEKRVHELRGVRSKALAHIIDRAPRATTGV